LNLIGGIFIQNMVHVPVKHTPNNLDILYVWIYKVNDLLRNQVYSGEDVMSI